MPRTLTFWSLIISSVYLFYLAAFSNVTIWHDSIGYQQLGNLLANGQWQQYFTDGPNREPLYPILVAAAMIIAKNFSISYLSVVMILQVFLLLFTETLMVIIMSRLQIRDVWQAIVILYASFSPSLNNFTFILWSDLTPAGLILLGILAYCACWKKLLDDTVTLKSLALYGLGLAGILVLLTLLKAAFELIGLLIILSFLFAIPSLCHHRKALGRGALFLLLLMACHQIPIHGYKLMNWHFNRHYTITDRGAWALYGNTMRRMEPLNKHQWLAAAAVVPHLDFCTMFMDTASCRFWGTDTVSNRYGFGKNAELSNGPDAVKADDIMKKLSIKAMLHNPPQAFVLSFWEGCKLLFWEYYTSTAYVVYPHWVQNIYGCQPLMLFLRTLFGILTPLSLVIGFIFIWNNQGKKPLKTKMMDERFLLTFAIIVWIISYALPYSLFFLFGRYALALAPLYLILIVRMPSAYRLYSKHH